MSPIEDQILQRIQRGLIELRGDHVWIFHRSYRRFVKAKLNQHPKSGRWRLSVRIGNKTTNVYLNRLIWMLTHRKPIPNDCFVDHINVNRMDDRPENLRLITKVDSHVQGQHLQQDRVLERLGRWFEWMAKHDREPELPHEISWVEDGF